MSVNVNDIEPDEKIVEIEMERLRSFRNHPFKVKADAEMLQLMESISKYGLDCTYALNILQRRFPKALMVCYRFIL